MSFESGSSRKEKKSPIVKEERVRFLLTCDFNEEFKKHDFSLPEFHGLLDRLEGHCLEASNDRVITDETISIPVIEKRSINVDGEPYNVCLAVQQNPDNTYTFGILTLKEDSLK